jgi:hypothetical protein
MKTIRNLAFGLLVLTCATPLAAQEGAALDPERAAELQRRVGGVQGGVWLPRDLPEVQGADYSTMPFFTGFARRGLDRHLAWETTVSFWRRTQEREISGGLGGSGGTESVTTYVVPLLTSLTFFPVTGPESVFEPFLRAGLGLTLGVDDRQGTAGGGLLGSGAREGVIMYTGIGARGGVGADLWLSRTLGLTVAGQYQWVRFLEGEPGGMATYQGPVLEAGLLYRFQF